MPLNADYFAHETLFLVRVRPVLSEMRDMLQFCQENVPGDWNFYPSMAEPWTSIGFARNRDGDRMLDPAYFWFADLNDMILFRLRFDSTAASTENTDL